MWGMQLDQDEPICVIDIDILLMNDYEKIFEYPIKLIYKKKYLPVIVLDKFETWRKISDFESNSGWIHISQLSKKKSAINIKNNSILFKKPTIYSKPIAKLESGRLVLIKRCKEKWCKITTGDFKGWIFESSLWGKIK